MENEALQQTGETAAAAVPQTGEETPPAAGVEAADPQDLDAEFEQLIKGKYKPAFDARMQQTIRARLKHAKETEEKNKTSAGQQTGELGPEAQQRISSLCSSWQQQEAQTRGLYPDFDLRAAMQDPAFCDLLRCGVDVRTAFEVRNRDRILPAAMAFAAQATQQQLARKLTAQGARPVENGMGSGSASLIRQDVSKLTKQQIDEVSRRVARGERVSFG